jgi:hypothetical protein
MKAKAMGSCLKFAEMAVAELRRRGVKYWGVEARRLLNVVILSVY